ncbi:MAG: thiamine-phosphate kinase, partial [Bacteroidota bacterium]|nr:thiamine-phosphate kinase [Bacteroidota bacterium]
IGDDCAIIPANDHEDWLITTDLLMEDVHFLRNAISPGQLGYKSLAVNLSDIASMGGTPVGSFLSMAIPEDIEVEYLDEFMKGYHQLSEAYHMPLLGGDTTRSMKHLAINICAIGKCAKGKARKRNMAQTGDAICVTGYLGDSAGGLQVLLNKLTSSANHDYLLLRHHLPEPRLKEGLLLAGDPAVHAMMDISDGIASDLKHILKASGVSAKIQTELLPLSRQLIQTAKEQDWNALELAVGGGEDYELLFTVEENKFDSLNKKFQNELGKPIIKIGQILPGNPEILWFEGDKEIHLSRSGFNHFQ